MEVFTQNFNNYGFLHCKFSNDDLAPVREEIQKIQEDFTSSQEMNSALIGNIEKEFKLVESKNHLEQLIFPLLTHYDQAYNYLEYISVLSKNVPIILKSAWVNFQLKHEFNPSHDHDGIFSFVIWTKIPYTRSGEDISSPGKKSKENLAGAFEFQYTDALGKIQSHIIKVDNTMENICLVFPAKLRHAVYPFFSTDDFRISVSGNFVFDV